ncbi:MAG: hypothetical protein ACREBG_26810 [Pyrinomonadaceae bacterium]
MKNLSRKVRGLIYSLTPVLFVVLVAGSVIYSLYPRIDDQSRSNLKFEVIKFCTQLIIIVLLGGVLVHEYNRRRQRDAEIGELRKEFLSNLVRELMRAYFNTKKARRILKANIRTNISTQAEEIPYAVYEEQLKEINTAQLEFEFHAYQLDMLPFKFENIARLKSQAEQMQGYLNELVEEYEKLKTSSQSVDVSKLPRLNAFILKTTFKSGFADFFHCTIDLIIDEVR